MLNQYLDLPALSQECKYLCLPERLCMKYQKPVFKTGGKKEKGFRGNFKFECEEKERLWLQLCAANSSRHSKCCCPLPTHPSRGGCVYSRSGKKDILAPQLPQFTTWCLCSDRLLPAFNSSISVSWHGSGAGIQSSPRGGDNQCLPWRRTWGDLVLLEVAPPDFTCKQSWGLKEGLCGRTFPYSRLADSCMPAYCDSTFNSMISFILPEKCSCTTEGWSSNTKRNGGRIALFCKSKMLTTCLVT